MPLPIALVRLLRRPPRVRVVVALLRRLLLVRIPHACSSRVPAIVRGLGLCANAAGAHAHAANAPDPALVPDRLSAEQALDAGLSLGALAIVVPLHLGLLLILLLALALCIQRPRRLGLLGLRLRLRLLRLLRVHGWVLDKRLAVIGRRLAKVLVLVIRRVKVRHRRIARLLIRRLLLALLLLRLLLRLLLGLRRLRCLLALRARVGNHALVLLARGRFCQVLARARWEPSSTTVVVRVVESALGLLRVATLVVSVSLEPAYASAGTKRTISGFLLQMARISQSASLLSTACIRLAVILLPVSRLLGKLLLSVAWLRLLGLRLRLRLRLNKRRGLLRGLLRLGLGKRRVR